MEKVPGKRSFIRPKGVENMESDVVNWTDLARDHVRWRTLIVYVCIC